MKISFFVSLLIILNVQNVRGGSDYHIHGEEWVDPDILSRIYRDRASKTVGKESRNLPQAEAEDGVKCDELAAIEGELKCGTQSPSDFSDQLYDWKCHSSSTPPPEQKNSDKITEQQECMQSRLYMKRFINILLQVSKLNEDMPQKLDAHLYITVTPEQLTVLQQFSKGNNDVTLQKLDHVLSSVLFSSSSYVFEEYISWSVITNILPSRENLMVLVLGCVSIFLIWKVLSGHSLYQTMMMILVSLFIISFWMTHRRMCKQAEIKQYATIKKNPEVPLKCRPSSDVTWFEEIQRVFHRDECHKYYEAVMIDPALEVTPTIVLSEVVSRFLLHPSGILGSAVADFSNSILENLPFGANYLVLLASFFFIIVIICVHCGAVIRLPFYMGGLEVSGRRRQEVITEGPQMSHGVGQGGQLSGDTISSLIQTAASTDTGVVIMNIHGIQRLLSDGNSAAFHRDAVEEIQVPSPKKKSVCCIHEKIDDQIEPQDVAGCCGESWSGCHHFTGDESVAAMSGLPQQPLRKNHTEELQLRKKGAFSESEVKHIQIQGLEVIPECTGGLQEKDLASADENKTAFATGDSSKIWETDVEGDVNRRRSDSTDGSDEEISFVKL